MQIVIIIIDIVVILLLVYTWMLLMKTRRIQKHTDELNRQTHSRRPERRREAEVRAVRPYWMAPFFAVRYAIRRRRWGAFGRYMHGWRMVRDYQAGRNRMMGRQMKASLDHWLTTPPEDNWMENNELHNWGMDFIHRVDEVVQEEGKGEEKEAWMEGDAELVLTSLTVKDYLTDEQWEWVEGFLSEI